MIFSSCLVLHPDFTGSRLSFWEASKYIGKVLSIQVASENSVDLNKLSNCFVLAREGYNDECDKVCGQNERCRECTRHTRPKPWSRKSSRSRGEGEIDSVRGLCFGKGFTAKVTPDSTLRNENRFRTRGFNFSQSEEIVALNFMTSHISHWAHKGAVSASVCVWPLSPRIMWGTKVIVQYVFPGSVAHSGHSAQPPKQITPRMGML